jgi:hypothetical protein
MVVSDESKQSLFERFAKLIVPVAATVGVFFQQKQQTVALSLVALAVTSLLVGEVPKLRARLKERRAKKDEEMVAALALDEVKGWIHKLLEFTSTQTSDAFYGIVWSRLCQSNTANFESLHIPPLQLFADFSRILATRTEERKPSREVLKQSIAEFNSLVGLYSSYVVCPVYDQVPLKLKPEILSIYSMNDIASDLIQFRERFDAFLGNYIDFLKALDRKLAHPLEPQPFGYYFARPKPLASLKTQTTVSPI